ncbi:MAG: hypothetical protein HFF10_05560 [Angelakisella sp.]|jgi:hypothetical protein|nr:hypothetical protein [Angelakisella sp.]
MDKQNTNNQLTLEFIKKAIKLRMSLRKRPLFQLTSKNQVQHLGSILEYRAQCSVYNVYQESEYGTPWKRYMTLLQSDSRIRKTVKHLITKAVINFDTSHLNFDIPHGEPIGDFNLDNNTVDFSPVLSSIQKKYIIDYLIIVAQVEFFQQLSASDPLYTWQEYFDGLHTDQNLCGKFSRAFQQGLWQMDFGKCWEDMDVEGIVLQYYIANACYTLEQLAKERERGWTSIFSKFWE